jgi:hypothetical protein
MPNAEPFNLAVPSTVDPAPPLPLTFQRQIKVLTSRCPVIVAEAAQVKLSVLRRASRGSVHVATVCTHPDKTVAVALESF